MSLLEERKLDLISVVNLTICTPSTATLNPSQWHYIYLSPPTPSFSLSLSLSHTHTRTNTKNLSLYLSLSASHTLPLYLSDYHSLCLSLSLSLSLSLWSGIPDWKRLSLFNVICLLSPQNSVKRVSMLLPKEKKPFPKISFPNSILRINRKSM